MTADITGSTSPFDGIRYVQITREAETAQSAVDAQPFVIGVLASLQAETKARKSDIRSRRFVKLTVSNFNDVLEAVSPAVQFAVYDEIAELKATITFKRLTDFMPSGILGQIPALKAIADISNNLWNLRAMLTPRLEAHLMALIKSAKPQQDPAAFQEALDEVLTELDMMLAQGELDQLRLWISEFSSQVRSGTLTIEGGLSDSLRCYIESLTSRIQFYISAIMRDEKVAALRSTWYGLWYLVQATHSLRGVVVRVLDVTATEILDDLTNKDRQKSALVDKIVEQELGTFGGEPYDVILLDSALDRAAIDLVNCLAVVCEQSYAVLIAGLRPSLLGVASYENAMVEETLARLASTSLFDLWKAFFLTKPAARVTLCFPFARLKDCEDHGLLAGGALTSEPIYINSAHVLVSRIAAHFCELFNRRCDLPELAQISDVDRCERIARFGIFPYWYPLEQIGNCDTLLNESARPPSAGGPGNERPKGRPGLLNVLAVSRMAHWIKAELREQRESLGTANLVLEYLAEALSPFVGEAETDKYLFRWASVDLILSTRHQHKDEATLLGQFRSSHDGQELSVELKCDAYTLWASSITATTSPSTLAIHLMSVPPNGQM